jgi:hypothetical protein
MVHDVTSAEAIRTCRARNQEKVPPCGLTILSVLLLTVIGCAPTQNSTKQGETHMEKPIYQQRISLRSASEGSWQLEAWMASEKYNRSEPVRLFLRLTSVANDEVQMPKVVVTIGTKRSADGRSIAHLSLANLEWEEGKDLFDRPNEDRVDGGTKHLTKGLRNWGVILKDIIERRANDNVSRQLDSGDYDVDLKAVIDERSELSLNQFRFAVSKELKNK